METGLGNITLWKQFVLLGLQNQRTPAFATVFVMFLIALPANSLLLFLIQVDSGLQTPMYFFLSQLSFMDMCQVLFVVPKMALAFVTHVYTVSLLGCAAQIFLTLTVGGAECLLLAVMSYDRYVAICRPLQYPVLMRRQIRLVLTAGVWLGASLQAMIAALYTLPLPYCGSNTINDYVCEYPDLLKLSCSDNSAFENTAFFVSIFQLFTPLSVIIFSYIAILWQTLRVHSSEGRQKALGTCLSHVCVVGIFYGAAILTYMTPKSSYTTEQITVFTVLSTVVPAMLNPFIYSLRNRDVLAALRKLLWNCLLYK